MHGYQHRNSHAHGRDNNTWLAGTPRKLPFMLTCIMSHQPLSNIKMEHLARKYLRKTTVVALAATKPVGCKTVFFFFLGLSCCSLL